jgi:mRNA-degrading endonuclease YafQ of YafQ-DinJ toxin-antitoxin module
MNTYGPQYEARYSEEFDKKKESKALRAHQDNLRRTCEKLLVNPYGAADSHRLKYDFAGLRAATVFGSLRVIFKVCEECRKLGDSGLNPLDCCESASTSDLTITFLDILDYH